MYCNFKVSIKTLTLHGNESGNFFCIFFILKVISHPEIKRKSLTEIEKLHFVYTSFFFIYFWCYSLSEHCGIGLSSKHLIDRNRKIKSSTSEEFLYLGDSNQCRDAWLLKSAEHRRLSLQPWKRTFVTIFSQPRLREHPEEGGIKQVRWGRVLWNAVIWTRYYCYTYKPTKAMLTYTKSSQPKLWHWLVRWSSGHSSFGDSTPQLIREEKSLFSEDLTPIGFLYFDGWLHVYAQMCSTNWTNKL